MEDSGLSKEELNHVLTFEGYGNKCAPYWFLGMEEGGGSMEQLRERANSFGPVEDLYTAHVKLGFENMYRHVPVWRIMSKLILAINGADNWQQTDSAREYQATKLGRSDGETFLTELMPLPAKSTGVWPYPLIYPTRDEYYADIRPGRIKWLRSKISAAEPRFVICYGKGNWRYYKEIFSGVEFRPKLNEKIRVGRQEPSTILLLPFFSYYFVTTELIKQIASLIRREHNER